MVQKPEDGLKVLARRADRPHHSGGQPARLVDRSTKKAQDLYRPGAIGTLNMVEAWVGPQLGLGAWQYSIPTDASPETVDWDRFIGSAPKRPFEAMRLSAGAIIRITGTGVAGDLSSTCSAACTTSSEPSVPSAVFASGGLRFWNDGRDVPDVFDGSL